MWEADITRTVILELPQAKKKTLQGPISTEKARHAGVCLSLQLRLEMK
jgi:hypothetical protein